MLAPSLDSLWLIPTSVFVAGLMGSPHCLTMCGPIVANFAGSKPKLIAYQAGRLFSYALMGALAGAFGDSILGSERPAWLAMATLLMIAVLLIFNAWRLWSGRSLHVPLPQWLSPIWMKIWRLIIALPPQISAGAAGLLTVLLPCGHLASFLVGAMVAGTALKGAGWMIAFWAGSMPLLSLSGGWLQKLLRPDSRHRPWAGAVLVVVGLVSLAAFAGRLNQFQTKSLNPMHHSHNNDTDGMDEMMNMSEENCH